MKKRYIRWPQVFERLDTIDSSANVIYGVPKGGMIVAGFLKHAINTYDINSANIILDDIIGSGTTERYYAEKFPNTQFVTLFNHKEAEGEWMVFPWEAEHPNGEDSVQQNIIRQIHYIGEDSNREGLKETPNRVVRAWSEMFSGYNQDVTSLFTVFEPDGYNQMVLLNNIEMYSTCEHHMLPFFGKAHIAYIPGDRVIGISKLARLIDIYARRLQIQERIGEQVTNALMTYLKPQGAICVIEATHLCMRMRGVAKQNSIMTTSSIKGTFMDPVVKQEFFQLMKNT